jgi:hypothetical protein
LQRQQTNDDLQTIDEPVLELLGQHVLALQEVGLLTKPRRFASASRQQFGSYCTLVLLSRIAPSRASPGKLKYGFLA